MQSVVVSLANFHSITLETVRMKITIIESKPGVLAVLMSNTSTHH